jgi:hypothetical protein
MPRVVMTTSASTRATEPGARAERHPRNETAAPMGHGGAAGGWGVLAGPAWTGSAATTAALAQQIRPAAARACPMRRRPRPRVCAFAPVIRGRVPEPALRADPGLHPLSQFAVAPFGHRRSSGSRMAGGLATAPSFGQFWRAYLLPGSGAGTGAPNSSSSRMASLKATAER